MTTSALRLAPLITLPHPTAHAESDEAAPLHLARIAPTEEGLVITRRCRWTKTGIRRRL